MFTVLISILWFILGIFGIKKVQGQHTQTASSQTTDHTPKLNKPTQKQKQTPTNLIREISRQAPNEAQRIEALKNMIDELNKAIEGLKGENEALAAENHQIRIRMGDMGRE